jgi:L-iditol 2-dehydrogenase
MISSAQEKIGRTMSAAVLYGKEDMKIEQVPMPQVGDGEALIQVRAALTCGTDLKVYRRGYHARMIVPPALFGHELAGVIEEVGGEVKGFKKADRVVCLNSAPCGECFYCQRQQENLCEDLLFINGAYAEYIKVPHRIVEKNLLTIPDELSFEAAALVEPLACVLLGLKESGMQAGDTVVIIGAGPIGLMFIQVAKAGGARVISVVKRDEQVELARQFGAADVVQIGNVSDVVEAVRKMTGDGRGADIVIEAVGRPEAWQWAVNMLRKGGTVNFFGGCTSGTRVELETNRIHYSALRMIASFHHNPRVAREALKLIADNKVHSLDYITGEAPLSELPQVFRHMMDRGSDIKTAIIPGR